jgi:hypothetical protein
VADSYDPAVANSSSVERRLAAFAVSVVIGHHIGTVLGPLGEVGNTRWADWADLLVPFAVVGFAAAVLASTDAGRREWILLGVTGVLYTQGHGIHLAANSIANTDPSDAVHLWDETVGHWLWYSGLAGIVATLALALHAVPLPRSVWALVLALLFGATIFTNSVEGGTAVLGLASAVAFIVWGLRDRRSARALLVPAYALALVLLLAWGLYWGGYPQFSELGWI